ncbi:MAG: TetR/AcrR family transcriptional regulator [Acidimicrobiia bacterium]|nr:TetR/AcrR family transcriptional regulator [Acidimicrobiia bacterium]
MSDAVHGTPVSNDLRARLIQAAGDVFAERGYEGAGVHEIARRAGLTTGAIYSRFRGKDELLLEAIEACMSDEIDNLLSGRVDDDAASIIAQLGSHLVDDEEDERSLLLEAIVAARREPALADHLTARLDDEGMRLEKLVEEAKSAGLIDPAYSTDALTTFCHAVSFGMLVTRSLGRSLPDHDHWDHLIGGLVAAIAPSERP